MNVYVRNGKTVEAEPGSKLDRRLARLRSWEQVPEPEPEPEPEPAPENFE